MTETYVKLEDVLKCSRVKGCLHDCGWEDCDECEQYGISFLEISKLNTYNLEDSYSQCRADKGAEE